MAELEAINLYEQMAALAGEPRIKGQAIEPAPFRPAD
jgi:rubrerythrin